METGQIKMLPKRPKKKAEKTITSYCYSFQAEDTTKPGKIRTYLIYSSKPLDDRLLEVWKIKDFKEGKTYEVSADEMVSLIMGSAFSRPNLFPMLQGNFILIRKVTAMHEGRIMNEPRLSGREFIDLLEKTLPGKTLNLKYEGKKTVPENEFIAASHNKLSKYKNVRKA